MTLDLGTAVWRKSSYSDGGGTNCVEVADAYPGVVPSATASSRTDQSSCSGQLRGRHF